MSIIDDKKEFKNAVRDIACSAIFLESEFDRVRCCEWVRKLTSLSSDDVESAKLKNDYIQYLRLSVRAGILHSIFLQNPPSGDLRPLAEALGTTFANSIPSLPEMGPIAPYLTHKSPDGRAYISIKSIPGNGVLCYMAVGPEGV
ncbi:hypothetical protein O3M35_001637 [Rhynocoris fuscipes]|uniref:DUF4485 domain-containing protein n=1 Tax=Rhynocoris fuscipes TaxID=488301 RepID=A0AAW1CPM7_9HEMI